MVVVVVRVAGFGYIGRMSFAIATLLKPFVAFLFIALFASPVKRLVQRRMRPGKLKRFLLWELDPEKAGRRPGKQPLDGRAQ